MQRDIYLLISITVLVGPKMSETATAKIFRHGRSQAVRLPKEFRLPGKEVRVRRVGRGVLLEPLDTPFDAEAWLAKLDQYLDEPFMPEGRQQPLMPPPRKLFE
jgi:antitoxin VapB